MNRLHLKYWRKRRKLTIKELAKQAGMSTETIVKIEKYGHIPGKEVLDKLERALNVTTDELFSGPTSSYSFRGGKIA